MVHVYFQLYKAVYLMEDKTQYSGLIIDLFHHFYCHGDFILEVIYI